MSLREKFLRERLRSAMQEPEVWALRSYLKRRRVRARLRLAASPDRPVLVVCRRSTAGGHANDQCGETARRQFPERRTT